MFSLLILFLSIVSCKDDSNGRSNQDRNDRAIELFEKSKVTEDINKKLSLLDSSLKAISKPGDTLKPIIYDHLIYYYNIQKELDSAIYYSDLLIDYGAKAKDTLQIAKGYYRKARNLHEKNDQINVLRNTLQSKNYYLIIGDSINAGKRWLELSIAQTRLGDFPGSQNSAVKALSLLENSQDSLYLTSAYNNLATTYRKLNDLDEAIKEYNNALKFITSRKDSVVVLNNIANIYTTKKEFDKSLKIFELNLPLAREPNSINRIKDNYYFTKWLSGELIASDSLKSVMTARIENNDLTGLLASYDHLVEVNEKDSPEKALQYAKAYYETAQKLYSVTDEISALNYLVRLSPTREIKAYALENIRLNDSLITSRDNVKNLFAKINYDEEKKLEEIEQLEKLSIQQQLEVLKGKNQRNIAILLGIIIIGTALVIYYFLKQRHKKERIREIHTTEARISKKIHDELANDVYNVLTEFEKPVNPDRENMLNKLESIYLRTRNISRENTPLPLDSHYQEDLHDLLSHSVPPEAKLYLLGFKDIPWVKISQESKIVIHRVLQELMVNMKKHSEASIVSLNFKETSSKLHILYNDNGKGIAAGEYKKGAGLKNVENRIETIGGSFNFKSENSNGFSAQILIPF